jgi:hypothetical protein
MGRPTQLCVGFKLMTLAYVKPMSPCDATELSGAMRSAPPYERKGVDSQ